jgi:hypothetical protein
MPADCAPVWDDAGRVAPEQRARRDPKVAHRRGECILGSKVEDGLERKIVHTPDLLPGGSTGLGAPGSLRPIVSSVAHAGRLRSHAGARGQHNAGFAVGCSVLQTIELGRSFKRGGVFDSRDVDLGIQGYRRGYLGGISDLCFEVSEGGIPLYRSPKVRGSLVFESGEL